MSKTFGVHCLQGGECTPVSGNQLAHPAPQTSTPSAEPTAASSAGLLAQKLQDRPKPNSVGKVSGHAQGTVGPGEKPSAEATSST